MDKAAPIFTINSGFGDIFDNPVVEEKEFYNRLLEFIETNLSSNYKTTVLCYLEDAEGNLSEASLEEEGYYKSLQKCIKYYTEIEKYETCSKIIKLIKDNELR